MVLRVTGSFHYPETRFISRCTASVNKPGQRGMDTACIPKNYTLTVLLYRYNTVLSVHLHLMSFL